MRTLANDAHKLILIVQNKYLDSQIDYMKPSIFSGCYYISIFSCHVCVSVLFTEHMYIVFLVI